MIRGHQGPQIEPEQISMLVENNEQLMRLLSARDARGVAMEVEMDLKMEGKRVYGLGFGLGLNLQVVSRALGCRMNGLPLAC